MGRKARDFSGVRVGKVDVISMAGVVPNGKSTRAAWNVKCDCGTEWVAESRSISAAERRGDWQCKPCRDKDMVTEHSITHYLYDTWYSMIRRCNDPRHKHYSRYGGRGITIHGEWYDRHSFFAYCDDVLGERPEGHTLDRIDNDGNYEPSNIRWASAEAQANNRGGGNS